MNTAVDDHAEIVRLLLRNERADLSIGDSCDFIEFVDTHWLGPVIHERMTALRSSSEIAVRLADETRLWALKASLRRAEMAKVIDTMDGAKVDCLLLKGLPLSYVLYRQPGIRPSCDADVFIREQQKGIAHNLLESMGYECLPFEVSARTPDTHQRTYEKKDTNGYLHRIDLHWRVSGHYLYSDLFCFDELWNRSIPVPQICSAARTLNLVDALILACTHLSISERRRLVWLCDIDLLVRKLDEHECKAFAALAARKRVKTVCSENIKLAQHWFGTPVPASLSQALTHRGFPLPEISQLALRRKKIDGLLLDLFSINGWHARREFLRELLLPSEADVEFCGSKGHSTPAVKRSTRLIQARIARVFQKCPEYFFHGATSSAVGDKFEGQF